MRQGTPHYVLGGAYQAGGVWFYPSESLSPETGLATLSGRRAGDLTADGEGYDPAAMTAGHQTLPLPTVALVTNLENGRQLRLRLNDRGPATPKRVIALTPRAAALLGARDGTEIRIEPLPGDSAAAADAAGGGPKLAIATAPRGAVRVETLGDPSSAHMLGAGPEGDAAAGPLAPLPPTIVQGPARPGRLMLLLGTFTNPGPARLQASRAAGLGAYLESGGTRYQVVAGPYATTQQADAALDQALGSGVTDARIIVE